MVYSLFYKYARLATPTGRELHYKMQELLRTQWLSPDELKELQLTKIKQLLNHAYSKVPFYQKRFQDVGLHPNDIKTLTDFQQVPIITKQDVQNDPDVFMAPNYSRDTLTKGMTGGSTGDPLIYYRDHDADMWNWALIQRNRSWFGFQEGMKQAWFWGRDQDIPESRINQIKTRLRRQHWQSCYNMGEDQMAAFAEKLLDFQPDFIFGYTSAIYVFAQYLKKQGITAIKPKAIQTAAEKLHDFQREFMAEVFQCPVIDHYAAMEIGTIAAQCLEGGMHIGGEVRYFETVVDNQPAKPGQMGETVLTDLTNMAMPYIRYKSGDLAVLKEGVCSCGRGLPLLGEVTGRKTDFFTMPSGKLVFGLYWGKRMREIPGVKRFRVHQATVDTIEISYEAENGFDTSLLEKKRQEILNTLQEPLNISFERVEEIPLSRVGKYLFISTDVPVTINNDTLKSVEK
jgi:phenylacetate-CoA ligase